MKSNVEFWKASNQIKKLEHRVDKAEDYAAIMTFLAMAMMEEADPIGQQMIEPLDIFVVPANIRMIVTQFVGIGIPFWLASRVEHDWEKTL